MKNINQENTDQHDSNLIQNHDYDGIQELDNPPPPWLMILFYITIAISAFYAGYYHWFGQGALQAEEYAIEMEQAAEKYKKAETVDLDNLELSTDAVVLADAAKLYGTSCAVCHGAAGEGNAIGPNLTDDYWITGNTPKAIYQTIKNGTPNGMTSFASLSDEQVLGLSSYILNKLKGSNPANPKDPQGEKM